MDVCGLTTALHRCGVVCNDHQYQVNEMVEANVSFLARQLSQGSSRVLCLHAGTRAMEVYSCILLSLHCIMTNELTPDEVVRGLPIDSMVVYGRTRGLFLGLDESGYAVIEQGQRQPVIIRVPRSMFGLIKPYLGKATTLDGRGLRNNPRTVRKLVASLLGIQENEVPSETCKSVVVVADRAAADDICRATISGPCGISMPLSSIVPCAYVTRNSTVDYPGNVSCSEAILKFTGHVSVARELILDDELNRVSALVFIGRWTSSSEVSELEALISRSKPSHVWILDELFRTDWTGLLAQSNALIPFAWTPRAVRESQSSLAPSRTDACGVASERLSTRVSNIAGQAARDYLFDAPINLKEYSRLRRSLLDIGRGFQGDEETETFVTNAFRLLRLLSQSVFPMKVIEHEIEHGNLRATSPRALLCELEIIGAHRLGELGEAMKDVYQLLSRFYFEIRKTNPKRDRLFERLAAIPSDARTAVVVGNESQATLLKTVLSAPGAGRARRVDCCTPNRFDDDNEYDVVLSAGALAGTRFSPARCICGSTVEVVAYRFEVEALRRLRQERERTLLCYDSRNAAVSAPNETVNPMPDNVVPADDDDELESIVWDAMVRRPITASATSDAGQCNTLVDRVAMFETGEVAFFTKNYCAYVFDPICEEVVEADVFTLAPGQMLVFATLGEEARDVVDAILRRYVTGRNGESAMKDAYNYSRLWKEVLRRHMACKRLTYESVALEMRRLGCGRHASTIRTWLDEDSHIVGPRDPKVFVTIGRITGDRLLQDRATTFAEACRSIRSVRVRILKHLGSSIVRSLGRNAKDTDSVLESVLGAATGLARILQLVEIRDPQNMWVPAHRTNRPLARTDTAQGEMRR
jgi:hypothetical protein